MRLRLDSHNHDALVVSIIPNAGIFYDAKDAIATAELFNDTVAAIICTLVILVLR